MRVRLTPRNDTLRPEAERLIADIYAKQYGALIAAFPDTLIVKVDGEGMVRCAAGLRFAAEGFFSEAYLDAPVEEILSSQRGIAVPREQIFEVTSLASRAPHLIGGFLRKIVACGDAAGFEWAFFTATAPLKAMLERLNLALATLAVAERARVPNPQSWGSYYAFNPQVYAVHRDSIAACLGREAGAALHG